MNAKYVVALILALQVTVSLSEIPPPSDELVNKYNEMKATFYRRLLNAYGKLQGAAAPVLQGASENEELTAIKGFVEGIKNRPRVRFAVDAAGGIAEELAPLVDVARTKALGAYEYYIRPYIGNQLSEAIDHAKVYLNTYMPAE